MGKEINREYGVEVLHFGKDEMWSLLDGQIHTLLEGRDYPQGCAFADVRKRLRQGAWRRGVTVTITHLGDKIILKSNEDSNEHAEATRAMNRRPWSKDQIENYELAQETARSQLKAQEWETKYMALLREHSAYRLAHPPREL